jgi:uncharacterized protein
MTPVRAILLLLACAAPGSGQSDAAQDAAAAHEDAAARAGGWRLAEASSPYVRAHADNPVEWFPWGPEAFARAKELDRPIFLSIGYSACHWCHRMEHDTFEDAECARLLNASFVSIKVDREERPDIDSRAMMALSIITGGGGWPASLFLTSDGLPFAGGTYFAPEEAPDRPGFKRILGDVSRLWATERSAVLEAARELQAALLRDPLERPAGSAASGADGAPGLGALVDRGVLELSGSLDSEHGGTFGAPKFPPPLTLGFLLRQHVRSGLEILSLLRTSLDAMAGGALQDHVGGGFHRYCVDEEWSLPHYEKLLGDNALLARVYAEAFAVTGEAEYADVARRTLDFMARELALPGGLYASSLDADSLPFDARGAALPGARVEEGRVYLWTPAELQAALGERDRSLLAQLFGVTAAGNAGEGRTLLRPMRTRTGGRRRGRLAGGCAARRRAAAVAGRLPGSAGRRARAAPAALPRREVPRRAERPGALRLRPQRGAAAGRRAA